MMEIIQIEKILMNLSLALVGDIKSNASALAGIDSNLNPMA